MLNELLDEIKSKKDDVNAKNLQRFFKTKKGEYGEGDFFLGIKVPVQRVIVKKYWNQTTINDVQELLNSKFHEESMIGILILVEVHKKSKKDKLKQRQIFEFYLKNTSRINNWDLVDLSASQIVGDFCSIEGTEILKFLAKSKSIWERRRVSRFR